MSPFLTYVDLRTRLRDKKERAGPGGGGEVYIWVHEVASDETPVARIREVKRFVATGRKKY
jgi:hypothetical protein